METRIFEVRQVRNFDQVISATFTFIRLYIRPLTRALISISGPAILLAALLLGLIAGMIPTPGYADPYSASSDTTAGAIIGGILLVVAIAAAYFLNLTTTLSFIMAVAKAGSPPPTVPEVWQRVKENIGRIILSTIAIAILYIVIQFVVAIPVGIAINIGGIVLAIPFYIALYAFFIYVGVSISLAFIIRIQENRGTIMALNRSFNIIQGYWWQSFGVVFVTNMLTSIIAIIPAYVLGVIAVITVTTTGSQIPPFLMSLGTIILSLITAVLITAGLTLYNTATALQYYSLVERKEAVGLHERVQSIEASIPQEGAL